MIASMTDNRDRLFFVTLLAHAPATFLIGMLMSADQGWLHVFTESIGPAVAAVVAYVMFHQTRVFRLVAAVLLMLYSGVIIHLGAGLVEWHFHVFVAMAMLVLYYDWRPIVAAAVTIAIHHILLDEVLPTAVFNHGTDPSRAIVVLHALFVTLHCVVLIWIAERVRRSAEAVETALGGMAKRSGPALADGLAALAAGDLTVAASAKSVRIASFGSDEIGRMAAKVNALSDCFDAMLTHYEEARASLNQMIEGVRSTTGQLEDQTLLARAAGHKLRGGTGDVSRAIEQVACSVEEASQSAADTNLSVGQLQSAIEGIAGGATEEARQV